jgi:hypothetical protein
VFTNIIFSPTHCPKWSKEAVFILQNGFCKEFKMHCYTRETGPFCMQEIASDILMEQTPKKLHQVRSKIYELLINVVPPELVIRQLTQELLKKLDDEVKHQVCSKKLSMKMKFACAR